MSNENRAWLGSGGNVSKAGLPTDRSQINLIIESATTQRYQAYQSRHLTSIHDKVVQKRANLLTITDWSLIHKKVDALVDQMRKRFENFNKSCLYVHLDMDAFFASVEERDDPELATIPMAVGSMSMLSTANYVARKYGVVSAMPGYIAKKLCPNIRIISHGFGKYRQASDQVYQVLKDHVEKQATLSMCLDEARFTITNDENAWNTVQKIRQIVLEKTRLSCSAGIAFSPALAKVTATILEQLLNVKTIEDLWNQRYQVFASFGPKQAEFLLAMSLGLQGTLDSDDDSEGDEDLLDRKSIGVERTMSHHPNMLSEAEQVEKILEDLAELLSNDLKAKSVSAKTITLKWKTIDFDVYQRSLTVPYKIQTTEQIIRMAKSIFKRSREDEHVRLLGLRATNLVTECTSDQQILEFNERTSTTPLNDISCPICNSVIARLSFEDPRMSMIVNVHLDRCLLVKQNPKTSTPTNNTNTNTNSISNSKLGSIPKKTKQQTH